MKRIRIDSSSHFIGKTAEGLISFGSGQPDLAPPHQIYRVIPKYLNYRYGLIQGELNLRQELAKQYPHAGCDQFVVTNGASEAIDLAMRCLANKGHKRLLLPRPYYYSYPHNVRLAGMKPVYYDLVDGKIDMDNFKKQLKLASVVLINSPSNPTGTIQDIPVLQEIEKLTKKRNAYVISDEVYKDLIYERENYLLKGPHIITINSFSKTYAMCGFRIGYLFSTDKTVVKGCIEMKTHTSMNTNVIGQEMAYEATKVPKSYVQKQVSIWKQRRDFIYQGMRDLGLDLWRPEGAFYVLPKFNKVNSNKVVNDLYYDYKIITYDGAWFGAPGRVRFSYALDIEKIKEGLKRLKAYLDVHPFMRSL